MAIFLDGTGTRGGHYRVGGDEPECIHCDEPAVTADQTGSDGDYGDRPGPKCGRHSRPAEPVTVSPEPDPRAQYVAGLRALANLLETQPDLVLPMPGNDVALNVYPKTKTQLATWVRAMRGKKEKKVDDSHMRVSGQVGGLKVQINAWRDEVCERVVVDTREVTERVPDPAKLARVPKVTVTRTEEIVEWRCTPILDDEASR